MNLHNASGSIEAVHLGHVDIHGDDVRPGAFHSFECFFSGLSRANHFDFRVSAQNIEQELPHCWRVFNH